MVGRRPAGQGNLSLSIDSFKTNWSLLQNFKGILDNTLFTQNTNITIIVTYSTAVLIYHNVTNVIVIVTTVIYVANVCTFIIVSSAVTTIKIATMFHNLQPFKTVFILVSQNLTNNPGCCFITRSDSRWCLFKHWLKHKWGIKLIAC